MKLKIYAWYCPVCQKYDIAHEKEQMAKPEHIAYRGVDLGNCKGIMIPLYMVDEKGDDSTTAQDALRYRWLRHQFSIGGETYIGEWCLSEKQLDEYIDEEMKKENKGKE